MTYAKSIIGTLTIVAMIFSGVLFGASLSAHAASQAAEVHLHSSDTAPGAGHAREHHGGDGHQHDGAGHAGNGDAGDQANHGKCNAMACCPVLSVAAIGPEPFLVTHAICHRPYDVAFFVQAPHQRADKPPRPA